MRASRRAVAGAMVSRTSDAEWRNRNAMRFKWHQRVIGDPLLTAGALKFAGLVMHRFRAVDRYAAVSHRAAARQLGMSERTMLRARDLLQERGWLYRVNPTTNPHEKNPTARYALGGGPDDLDLSAHADTNDST